MMAPGWKPRLDISLSIASTLGANTLRMPERLWLPTVASASTPLAWNTPEIAPIPHRPDASSAIDASAVTSVTGYVLQPWISSLMSFAADFDPPEDLKRPVRPVAITPRRPDRTSQELVRDPSVPRPPVTSTRDEPSLDDEEGSCDSKALVTILPT